MKIVRNYKGLKKWAKTLFVALLTICIVFTTTGVGTLIAYADECTAGGEHEAAASQWLPDDNNTHSYYTKCAICHENLSVENSEPHVFDGYEEKDADSHYKLCSKCGARIEEAHTDSGDGTCVCGYAMNPAADPPTDPVPDCSEGHTRGDNPQYGHPSATAHSYVCTVCGQTITEDCTFDNGVCTVCGASEPVMLRSPLRSSPTYSNPNQLTSADIDGNISVSDLAGMGITLLYETSADKQDYYVGSCHFSVSCADPNVDLIGLSTSDLTGWSSSVNYETIGNNQTVQKYLKIHRTDTGQHYYYILTIPGITIINGAENTLPNGTITVGSYTSTNTDATVAANNPSDTKYTTDTSQTITITASDASGISSIQYYVSDGYVVNPASILSWTTYDPASRPSTPSGRDCYIYAKITDNETVPKVSYRASGKIAFTAANGPSTGKITVDDYSSDKIAATDETVYITREQQKIKIEAANATSGVQRIDYAISEDPYYTVSDILGAVIDEKMKWKPYSDTGRPTLPLNKASYVYARITGNDGSYTYLSTGKLIHDTTPPTVDSVTLNSRSNDQILPITGKDTLSGIDTFYVYYEPKKDDSKVPTAEEVINKGVATQVEVRDGKSAAASVTYSTNDLLKDVTYSFYVVAKDKAGNISAVKTYETKGEGPASKDVSGNSIDSGSDGSGLAAAPNGIAGSGGGSTPKGSGSSGLAAAPNGIAGSGSGSGSGSALDRQINRKPYISDATGDTKIGLDATGGWDKITDEVKGATEGTSMDVEMAGLSVIPDRVLGALRGRDLSVTFKLPQDVEWQINGKDIETSSGADIDMGVVVGARNIPLDMLDAVTGTFPHTEIELKHDGPLGFTGKLRVPLGASNAGMYAYLYYYDTEAQELVLKQSSQVNSVGMAEFDFNHASDYTIVLRADEMMTGTAETDEDAAKTAATFDETSDESTSGSYVFSMSDAVGSSASVRIWLFAVAIISALLCGAILFMPGLQLREAE